MKVSFFTLGCKVNTFESQSIAEEFINNGYEVVKGETADIFVVNSCTVTHIADRKSRNIVRRLRRKNPNAIIILTGCMPQTDRDSALSLLEADIVLGNAEKPNLFKITQQFMAKRDRIFKVGDIFQQKSFSHMEADKFDDSFQRAYLKIEDGCDCFCAYCAIGFARGPVRSENIENIEHAADGFIRNGYKELVLTGINLSRYGFDLNLRPSDAIAAVCRREGDFRVRLGSVEPNLMDFRDFEVMKDLEKLCPHFHLALQSGCDETLKRMGRRYTSAQYMQFVDYIFKNFNNPSITTDIIVGFPGETEEEFKETEKFVSSLPLLKANIFEYSQRKGTRAEKFPDQINPAEKTERFNRLSQIAEESRNKFLSSQIGTKARVLGEKVGSGYTDNYISVSFVGKKPAAGQWYSCVLNDIDKNGMISELE